MRYINLFGKLTNVQTTKVFNYNNQIVFAVPKTKVSLAIGKNAVNVKKLSEILRRKIKVVALPLEDNNEGICKFVEDVVEPIEFNKVEVKDDSVVISAGRQSKAALIGRNRAREKELSEVLKNFFHITKFRIA
jgi:transcription termination/antitermination protein NusA